MVGMVLDMQHVSRGMTGTTVSSYVTSTRQSHGMRLRGIGQCRRICCRANSSSSSSRSQKKKGKGQTRQDTARRDGYRDAPNLSDDIDNIATSQMDDSVRSNAYNRGQNTVGTRVSNTPLSAGMKRVLKPLANLRLAIAELASISALSAVGTVIEQNKPAEFYVQQFPEQGNKVLGFLTYKIIFALQLDHIYSANYFLGLLALLGGSLMACTATTQLPMVKVAQRWRFKASESGYQNLPVARRIQDARLSDVATLLMKKNYRIFIKDGALYAFKGLGGKLAPIGVHASMIFTMVGIVLGIVSGFSGTAMITEGESTPFSSLLQPSTLVAIPPKGSSSLLRVDDFRISYRPDGSVQQFFTDVSVEDEAGRTLMSKTISVNQPLRFGGITAYQTDWSMSALSISLPESSKEGNIVLPMAPLKGVGGSDGKLYGSFLPLEAAPTADSTPKGISFLAKDLESVVVYDSSGKFVGVRRPTSKKPITVDGVDVVIQNIVASSGMELKSDPGIPLVYAGFGGICITTVLSYLSHSQVWGMQSGSSVVVGGKTNRALVGFQVEMDEVVESVPEYQHDPEREE